MAVTQLSSLNGLYNTIYERALFVARDMNIMVNLVANRDASGWMNRVISTRPQITAGTVHELTDYSAPTTFGLTATGTLTPVEYMAQVLLTDRAMETDPWGAQNDAIRELGASIADNIDLNLMGVFDDFGVSKGTAGTLLPLRTVAAALSRISAKHARQFGRPNVVLHPYQWHDIHQELGQTGSNNPPSEFANMALRDYYVGNALGANWYTSTNTAGTAQAGTAVYGGAFTQDAIMLDTRRPTRLEVERDASARADELNITVGYAHGVYRADFGCGILSDASEPS